jgi:hypothetical protein
MKRLTSIGLAAVVAVGLASLASDGRTQTRPPSDKKEPVPTTEKLLMRDKLTYAKDALDGLSVEDFDKVAKAAEMMRIISRASSWYVIDSDEYRRHSKDFQEQAADLGRHAKDKNLDAAALDYVRISLTCVQCHKYVRDERARKKP